MSARRGGFKDQQRWLAYCETELRRDDLPPARRQVLEGKRDFLARQLARRCRCCGRRLENDESVAKGIGPECEKAVAS